MSALSEVRKHMRPGQVYRREDLAVWSNAVDRHLKKLMKDSTLHKLSGGLYYYPEKSSFGDLPPQEDKLVEAFLKDSRFLLLSRNDYNALGVGTTQLYNETVVYNHKRHGKFKLGNRTYNFVRKPHFPLTLSQEFLLVDLLNNITSLAEDRDHVQQMALKKATSLDYSTLKRHLNAYGGVRAKKLLTPALESNMKT